MTMSNGIINNNSNSSNGEVNIENHDASNNNNKNINDNNSIKPQQQEQQQASSSQFNHQNTEPIVTQLHPTIVQDTIPYVILCIAILHGIYLYFYNAYAYHKTMFFGVLHIPSMNDCITIMNNNSSSSSNNNNEKCGRPDLFAFQMVSGMVFIIVSLFGLHAWYHHTTTTTGTTVTPATTATTTFSTTVRNNKNIKKRYILSTPASRLYGYQYESYIILIINLSYQIWDFMISIYAIPEYCTTIMLLHHSIAACVAYYGLYNNMFSYYAIFFLGLSEVSSIFLVSLDLHKYFIPIAMTTTTSTTSTSTSTTTIIIPFVSNLFFTYSQHIAGPCFVITFLYYRIVLWYTVSRRLWADVYDVTTATTTSSQSIGIATPPPPTTTTTTTTTMTNKCTTTSTTTNIIQHQSLTEQLRPHRTYILYIWLFANLPMGIIQLYFLSLILYEIQQKFF